MSQVSERTAPPVGPTPLSDKRRKSLSKGFFASAFERFLRDRVSLISMIIFVIIALLAICAPLLEKVIGFTRDEQDLLNSYAPPGTAGHILGADELGRDILIRLLWGGQVSLSVGFLVALISGIIGTLLGLLAGYFGGWVDDVVNAAYQIVANVPTLFLLIILGLYFKPDVLSLSITFGLLSWAGNARQIRGATLSLRSRDYIDAALVMGANNSRIMGIHLLPNLVSTILVVAAFDVVGAMLGEAGLSYLGYGISVPIPSWGNMIADGNGHLTDAPWLAIFPGVMIFITVLCIFLLADGLRDAFDPRLKEKG